MPNNTDKYTDARFDAWLAKVDAALVAKVGLGYRDIDDYCYRDAFEDGATPSQAARAALRACNGDD